MQFYFSETPKEKPFKTGDTALCFNVVIETDLGMFAITGFRLAKGKVIPPAVMIRAARGAAKWIDTFLMSDFIALRMVQALRAAGYPVDESDEEAAKYCFLTQEKIDRVLT